ncbi:MAG: hypothetical protein JXB18_11720 [Sedimentisphaerales bacterium]|nr:hypothetical protein [Sedimentisphaerales bacterium]
MCVMTTAKAVDIEFDVTEVSHPYAGFGVQVWPGDMRAESLFADLNVRYMRMCPGGCSNPPTDAAQSQMDAYVSSEYNGTTRGNSITASLQMAERLDVQVILNMFGGPAAWLGTNRRLKAENFDDFARLWATQVYFFTSRGHQVRYIELANEPEGDWNIYIPPADYNTVVKQVRQELDSRGLADVGIVGPGLAYLYHGPSWISALDNDARAALAGWSTHAWDEGWGNTDALPSFLDMRWREYFGAAAAQADPSGDKLIIVTEYATGVRTYNGVNYGSSYTETTQFAQRSYENSLTLLNNGANVLCYWEAANQSWQPSPMSGLLRTDSSLRPVYYALKTLAPYIPDGAMVLQKTWNDPAISAAGFIGDHRLVMAFANSTAGTVTRELKIKGITSFLLSFAEGFESGTIVDKSFAVQFNYNSAVLTITLSPESTLTVAAAVDECEALFAGDLTGDCRVAMDDFEQVASDWQADHHLPSPPHVIADFESYPDIPELTADWTHSANVLLSVDTSIMHSGAKAMKYQYNNGISPYYAKASFALGGTSGTDWTGYDTLTVWFKCTAKKEPMQINITNRYGTTVLTTPFGTPQAGDWTRWDIDLSPIALEEITRIGRLDIFFTSQWYGAGTVYFDDIHVSGGGLVCSAVPAGDVNGDCMVNLQDIVELSENWMKSTLIE